MWRHDWCLSLWVAPRSNPNDWGNTLPLWVATQQEFCALQFLLCDIWDFTTGFRRKPWCFTLATSQHGWSQYKDTRIIRASGPKVRPSWAGIFLTPRSDFWLGCLLWVLRPWHPLSRRLLLLCCLHTNKDRKPLSKQPRLLPQRTFNFTVLPEFPWKLCTSIFSCVLGRGRLMF